MPGVTIDPTKFIPMLDRAEARGFVEPWKAQFCREGLCYGFDLGVDPERVRGQREFKNYTSAIESRSQVTKAVNKRVAAGKTLKLGVWSADARTQLRRRFPDYIKSPVGAAAKWLDGVKLEEVRPFNDHTRSGFNDMTDDPRLRHTLDTYNRMARAYVKDWYARVADVDAAFPLLPIHWRLWPAFFFSFWESDDAGAESLYVHTCGDFGTRGMPGTFKIFFVDCVVATAQCELVVTLPLEVYVDDTVLLGPDREEVDRQGEALETWCGDFGVFFKRVKVKPAAQPQLYVGFVWDSRDLTRTLEPHKLAYYIELLRDFAGQSSLSLSELQSIAGKAQRGVMTLPPGSSCLLANMFNMTHGLKFPWSRRRTNAAVRQDFSSLADLLESNCGRGYYNYSEFGTAPCTWSDASKSKAHTGGGYLTEAGKYDFWRYGTSAARKPIDELEGDTVVHTVEALMGDWRHCLVPFGVDNQAFQKSAAKGWSHAVRLQRLVVQLFHLQMEGDFILQFFWLASQDNELADHLSRDRESEFLRAAASMGIWAEGIMAQCGPYRGTVRGLAKGRRDCVNGDGPAGIGKGILQRLSVHYKRTTLTEGMDDDYVDRLNEILDNRLRPSSMRTVEGARRKWQSFADTKGFSPLLKMDDPERGSKLAMFVMYLADNTTLTYNTISGYVWGVCMWLSLQHLPDPRMGVMQWGDFMAAIKVLTWVPSEPRRQIPFEYLEQALHLVDLSSFREVQAAHLVNVLLFTFSRSEAALPKNFSGEESFDPQFHWVSADMKSKTVNGRAAFGVRMKGNKTDPRVERPTARGEADDPGDWVYIGNVVDSVFSIFTWHRRLMAFHKVRTGGAARDPSEPFYLDEDQSRPLRYRSGLADLRFLLAKVPGCDPEKYGLHSLRVSGYNWSKRAVGEELTVAHGGWTSSAHTRYERFQMGRVLAIAPLMVGQAPPEEQAPQPREINRGPAPTRGESSIVEGAPMWAPREDEDDHLVALEDDDERESLASGFEDEEIALHPLLPTPAASSAAAAAPATTFVPLAALGLTTMDPRSPSLPRD